MPERRTINRVTPRRRPTGTPGPTADRARATEPSRVDGSSPAATCLAQGEDAPRVDGESIHQPAGLTVSSASPIAGSPDARPLSPMVDGSRLGAATERFRPLGRKLLVWSRTLSTTLRALPGKVIAFLVQVPTLAKGPRLALALSAIAVLFGCFAGLAAWRPATQPGNQAFVDVAETTAVRDAAVRALTVIDQYRADRMGEFKERVRRVLTDSLYREFLRTADATISFARQSRIDTRALVDPVGVTMLDTRRGRAELLVDLTVSGSRHGAVTSSGQDSLVVRMRKVDNRWLISDIPDHG